MRCARELRLCVGRSDGGVGGGVSKQEEDGGGLWAEDQSAKLYKHPHPIEISRYLGLAGGKKGSSIPVGWGA